VARISLEIGEGLAFVRMDDGRANAISAEWLAELGAALDAAERSDAAAVVLEGRPGFFSAGLDRTVLPGLTPEAMRETTGAFVAAVERVFLFPRPVVAVAEGHALAGGFMLFCAADLRLALDEPKARYGLVELRSGIPVIGPTAAVCRAAVPPEHHAELLLHGRLLSAREADERGVVHGCADTPESLRAQASVRAGALRGLDRAAYHASKLALRRPLVDAARDEARAVAELLPRGNPFGRAR
jgi:enoyl-CoA hydratase/carnithine racemase